MEKMLGGAFAHMAHLPQISLIVPNREAKTALNVGTFTTINESTRIVNECETQQDKVQALAYQGSLLLLTGKIITENKIGIISIITIQIQINPTRTITTTKIKAIYSKRSNRT